MYGMAPFGRFRGVYVGASPLVLLAFAVFAASPRAVTASGDDLWCGANISCYDVLKLRPNATSSEIKKSYFKLSLKWHPDKNPSDEAKGEFAKLARAYEILSEPRRREVRMCVEPPHTQQSALPDVRSYLVYILFVFFFFLLCHYL